MFVMLSDETEPQENGGAPGQSSFQPIRPVVWRFLNVVL